MATTSSASQIQQWLDRAAECAPDDYQCLGQLATELAAHIQRRAQQLQTPAERRQQAELDRLVRNPHDKATLMQLTDQAFRSKTAARAADQLIHILDVQGIPRFFSPVDRTMLRGFQSFGSYLPGVAVPLVKEKMRHETANVVLPAEWELLRKHLEERRREGVRMNLNLLGEAILGEGEAQRRLEAYLAALQMPEIECVSIKISTLYSQISPLARTDTIRTLANRLELLYRAAQRNRFRRHDGSEVPKFVYLDMEEYRDMWLTVEVFMETLDREGLEQARAGIALQAYIPDSFRAQRRLTEWARQRVAAGKSPVTLRIVKGANMEMERVEASLRGWPQAPFKCKLDTDANYKKMLEYGLRDQHIQAVHLGVASHNLFEVAFALLLAARRGFLKFVQFEMLEGMANPQRRALRELVDNLLLYAPACRKEDFVHAIGYLVRRMDENTGPDNFLRHAFKVEVGSADWERLKRQFLQSIDHMRDVSDAPRRTQNRQLPPQQPELPADWRKFRNEPDTDFSLLPNCQWAWELVERWRGRCNDQATDVLGSVGDHDEEGAGELVESIDPSRPGVVVARYRQLDAKQVDRAVAIAVEDPAGWRRMPPQERFACLRRVAQNLRTRRADLIGAAMADGGKTILEADPEVSEAVDFVEFYARTALELQTDPHLGAQPQGTVAVISPWNFPIAIPCGGTAAALAAGNTVLLKPASDTVLPARILCECFWEAGVPRAALQLVPCSGEQAEQALVNNPQLQTFILTGGTATAERILQVRPELRLLAETGGKNATIVTSMSDRDQAIKHVLHSAFSHAGQKCSATSLLLLEEEVYHDQRFKDALVDATESMHVGPVWDLKTKMGPLIRPPRGALARGLKELEPGESWLLMPRDLNDNPCLWSPGIKWNVQPGSFTHCTELFGPVLAVMPFRKLDEAIEVIHRTGYGLTSGLESLDDREQEHWIARVRAGNLYVNRPTTGAIVLRQPFGGMGKSAYGPGIKAGGPNYVVPLCNYARAADPADLPSSPTAPQIPLLADLWHQLAEPETPVARRIREELKEPDWRRFRFAISSYDAFAREEIRQEHDTFRLLGEDNRRRYLPMTHIRLRVTEQDTWLTLLARVAAVAAVGGRAAVSFPPGYPAQRIEALEELTEHWGGDMEYIEETDEGLIDAIDSGQVDRIRYAGPYAPVEVRMAADRQFVFVADAPIHLSGRVELLWYVREQSVTVDYHRYGNLGVRADEPRAEPL